MDMMNSYKQTITITKLQHDAKNVDIKDKSDHISYPVFLEYFRKLKKITKSDLIIGINFAYGWMPTMFKFKNDKLNRIVELLNKARNGAAVLSLEELKMMKSCLNNSIVGSSKLLHFVNPELYPIWDSRVYDYLTEKKSYPNECNRCNFYFDFINFCRDITKDAKKFASIKSLIESKVGYKITAIRAAELIMYHNGEIPKK